MSDADKQYTQNEMDAVVNASPDAAVRQRMAAALSGGYDFADTLHNVYLDYGYPAQLSFFNFWNMYRRFGIATRVVEIIPDQTWMDDPIVEGGDKFDRDLAELVETKSLWRRLKGLDTRQRVGRYAGVFIRVRDGKEPDKPLDTTLAGLGAYVDMVPLYESQLTVNDTVDDPKADDYGMPKMYQFDAGTVGTRNDKKNGAFNIHPSRIVIASEGADNANIYGVPALESSYNSLMDLRKIIGAGGEGFYKNAAQSVVFDLKDPGTAKGNATLLSKFNEQYDEFAQNRHRRSIWTPGMEAKVLDSQLANPKEFFMNALYDVAASSGVPANLLIGSQTGRLAGDQDTDSFMRGIQTRRVDFAGQMVRDVLDWFVANGVLPSADYTVEWADASAPSASQKLANADKMADVNQKVFLSGGQVPFTGEEIRESAGFDAVAEGGPPPPTDENDIED